jgi:indolepyruvate ferredoxin oxidoreductase, alpha subunit
VDFYQVAMPYPLHRDFIHRINSAYQKILVLEETYPVIELQLGGTRIQGRTSGIVPRAGELTPDVIRPVLETFLELPPRSVHAPAGGGDRPTLCAGCAHRAAFYAIRETFPAGIFPSDIGCYTLGLNLGAVDTCHCMGAGISQAAGFYRAYAAGGEEFPPIVATIGDSTFFHAGVPALLNAVFHRVRFILVILDNATTAMTGHQPTPQVGLTATGAPGHPVLIPDLVRACGVGFLREADPYDLPAFIDLLQAADVFCRSPEGGVAVLIAKHPCLLDREVRTAQTAYQMCITEDCTGCQHCLEDFECPALSMDEADGRVVIDRVRCVGCGVCVHVCPAGAITARQKGEA